jgi:hypothetical protein
MKTLFKVLSFFLLGFILNGFAIDDIIPKGWFKAGNNPKAYRVGIDNKIFRHATKSAFIESIDKQPTGFCTLMQTISDQTYSNKRVRMTGYIKSEGKADTALMWVRIDDLDKRVMADFDNMRKRPVKGTSDWNKYEIVFDVPSSKCTINFGLVLIGSGKAWMDNVAFEIVDKSTMKTATNSGVPLPSGYVGKEAPKISNLDFEN